MYVLAGLSDKKQKQWVVSLDDVTAYEQVKMTVTKPVDGIYREFLKVLDVVALSWLTRLYHMHIWDSACRLTDWGSGQSFLKRDTGGCVPTRREIKLLSLSGKVYSRILEGRVCRELETQILWEQCGFNPDRKTKDQL